MTALYLIVAVTVSSICANVRPWTTIGNVTLTEATFDPKAGAIQLDNAGCACTSELHVNFTRTKTDADAALERGERVWKFGLTSGIVELKRESKTTYSVNETPVEISEPLSPLRFRQR